MTVPNTGADARSIATTERIIGVDVARCLALLGMITAHLVDQRSPGSPGGVDVWHQVVSGRSSALFAVLAGVSVALVTRRERPGQRVSLATRALLVALIGLFLGGIPTGIAVILVNYGLLFLLAIPVLRWRAGPLALLAVGWGLLSPVVSMLVRPHLPERSGQVPNPISLLDPWQLATELAFTGYYPVLTWATYLFAGMAIGRVDLSRPRWGRRLVMGGAALAFVALRAARRVTGSDEVRSALLATYDRLEPVSDWSELETVLRIGLYGTTPTGSPWWLAVWSPHSGSIVDLAHTTGTSMLVLGLALLAVELGGPRGRRRWQIAAGAGTMTLTLYVGHVLTVGISLVWLHLLAVLLIGAVVTARGGRGPLERVIGEMSATAGNRHALRQRSRR